MNNINFINRNEGKVSPNKIDAIKIIDYYLSLHPLNIVNPKSLLYQLAVQQHNDVIKNSQIRPTIPTWYCGKVNPDTNELLDTLTDEELRGINGFVNDLTPAQLEVLNPIVSGYPDDQCLKLGRPGSFEYAKCFITSPYEDIPISGINWSEMINTLPAGYMEPEIIPNGEAGQDDWWKIDWW